MLAITQLPGRRVRARWFRTWNAELDAALSAMPESECCPHELYRLLGTRADPTKAFALVEDRGRGPVGVAGLRWRAASRDWVPLTHHMVPGVIVPVRDGSLGMVLSALHRNLWLDWWRMGEFTERVRGLRSVEVTPTFGIDDPCCCEEYWHQSHQTGTVKRAVKHCEGFEFRVNAAGMSRWVITNWESKWRLEPGVQRPDLEDKIVAAEYLGHRGKNFTFTLHDGDRPVAGLTALLHRGALVFQYSYRDPGYDKFGAGVCVVRDVCKWAAETGIDSIDLGSEHADNKSKWGPVTSDRTTIHICPRPLHLLHTGRAIAGRIRAMGIAGALKAAAARITRTPPHPAAAH